MNGYQLLLIRQAGIRARLISVLALLDQAKRQRRLSGSKVPNKLPPAGVRKAPGITRS